VATWKDMLDQGMKIDGSEPISEQAGAPLWSDSFPANNDSPQLQRVATLERVDQAASGDVVRGLGYGIIRPRRLG